MRIILLEQVENLGGPGDIVEVADGYARNYLMPRGMAQRATKAHIARLEEELNRRRRAADEALAESERAGERLEGLHLNLTARAGASGKLFGSVTSQDIADAVLEEVGLELDRRKIQLSEPIRELGEREVIVDLHAEVKVPITVEVSAEE